MNEDDLNPKDSCLQKNDCSWMKATETLHITVSSLHCLHGRCLYSSHLTRLGQQNGLSKSQVKWGAGSSLKPSREFRIFRIDPGISLKDPPDSEETHSNSKLNFRS